MATVKSSYYGVLLTAAGLLSACVSQGQQVLHSASARVITDAGQLIGGEAASGRIGDILIANDRVRFIVQHFEFNGQRVVEPSMLLYGGGVIDADIVREPGEPGGDVLGEVGLFYNFGRTVQYDSVVIVDDGTVSGSAVVELRGRDAAMTNVNIPVAIEDFAGGSAAAILGDLNPDPSLPLHIVTRYTLRPDATALEIETRFGNSGSQPVRIIPGDMLDSGGDVSPFFLADHGILRAGEVPQGYGEPKHDLGNNRTELVAFRGRRSSYAYIPMWPGQGSGRGKSGCVMLAGVAACVLGTDIELGGLVSVEGAQANAGETGFALDSGSSGEFLTVAPGKQGIVRRYLSVGDGDLADTLRPLEALYREDWGMVSGRTTLASGAPLADVDVAVLVNREGEYVAYTSIESDAQGDFKLRLPPGSYRLVANARGHDAPDPFYGDVQVAAGDDIKLQTIVFEPSAEISLFVYDETRTPTPARIWVFGTDPSPDFIQRPGTDDGDLLPVGRLPDADSLIAFRDIVTDGLAKVHGNDGTATITDWQGESATVGAAAYAYVIGLDGRIDLPLESGTWTIVATRGLEYGFDLATLTVASGEAVNVALTVPKVVDSFPWLGGDLHVHTANSPDAGVSHEDRVKVFLADGVDVLVTTDHGYRTDLAPVLEAMEVDFDGDGGIDRRGPDMMRTLVGEELTTWDLGHFNAYPLTVLPTPVRDRERVNAEGVGPGQDAKVANTVGGAQIWWNESQDQGPGTVKGGVAIAEMLRASIDGSDADGVVQINHPFGSAMQSYFDVLGLGFDFTGQFDPEDPTHQSAIVATLSSSERSDERSQRRLPDTGLLMTDFDMLEIANGPDLNALAQGMNTWFGFLNIGKRTMTAGNSDTHDRYKQPAGIPRTYAQIEGLASDSAGELESGSQFTRALREGRSFVGMGFFLDVTGVLDVYDGTGQRLSQQMIEPAYEPWIMRRASGSSAAGLAANDLTAGYHAHLTLYVRSQSPDWAPPARVDVYSNTPYFRADPDAPAEDFEAAINGSAAASYAVSAVAELDPSVDRVAGTYSQSSEQRVVVEARRYELLTRFDFALTTTTDLVDRWFVVRVSGSQHGFPVLYGDGDDVRPMSFTNPIWLDVDGAGWQAACDIRACE